MTPVLDRVLILGADGQLGTEFRRWLPPPVQVFAVDRADFDIVNTSALTTFAGESRPSVIINCAAFNDVDRAERQPLEALYTNAFAVGILARLACQLDATLVHFGSDFVFDGEAATPYAETDEAHPLSVYGMSKWLGETAAQLAPKHYVLRLSSLYGGAHRRSFVDRIATALQSVQPLDVFTDRIVSPSYNPDVVRATLGLLAGHAPFGVYNCASTEYCGWYDLACEIARQLEVSSSCLRAVPFAHGGQGAHRPRFCALSSAKLAGFVETPRHWREALKEHLGRHYPPMPPPAR